MQEIVCMIIFSIIYLVWGFSIVLFPAKFKEKVEKSSKNGIRMIGLAIAGASIISLGWIYLMTLGMKMFESLYR